MLRRTEGIVLRTVPFSEADLIVTYLTSDFGLLKTFAKSPRKIKSRFGSSLEPLTHSRISFWSKEEATLPKLTQSDIIYSFQTIRDNLHCFLKVSEMIELTLHFLPERETNKKAFSLLLSTLHGIENILNQVQDNKDLRIIYYKIKFLELTGYAPKLDGCGRCGKKGYNFYMSHGSILCEVCAKGMSSPARLSSGTIKLYTNLLAWDVTKIKRIRPSNTLLSELSEAVDMHIEYILTRPLRSKSFNLLSPIY
jgi:DNA repair protein RecO (recombination protein O)